MKLILFDVDGTLVDSHKIIHECMVRTFHDFGHDTPSSGASASIIGLTLPIAIATILGHETGDAHHEMAERYKSHYLSIQHLDEFRSDLFPGIGQMLSGLQQHDHLLLGIVTGKSRRGINHLIDNHDLDGVFITSRCSDECPSKPHPAMVLECCEDTGIDPADAIVIGDTHFDMEMAKSAKSHAVGVSWGNHAVDDLWKGGADHVADNAMGLTDYLLTWAMPTEQKLENADAKIS